jgi:hypothetical protein
MPTPPLKTDPKYGYFPRWPEDGNDWIHPEDIDQARALIPSGRVFRREGIVGQYSLLHYGHLSIRVRPALWQEVMPEGLDIGDWVEVVSRGMLNSPHTGTIREMLWDEDEQAIRYQITVAGRPIERLYARQDLQPVDPV